MKRLPLPCPFSLRAVALTVLSIVGAVVSVGGWYLHPVVERTDGVVYGQRNGDSLSLDVIRPAQPNGLGVAFMVSGGWRSGEPGELPVWMMAPLLR
ncbi:MAG TPA: hypothetical protein EYG03_17340, partial [Planctomycetes bacterium]|nr:hypothetical protein [Planctomycetota bacterium]